MKRWLIIFQMVTNRKKKHIKNIYFFLELKKNILNLSSNKSKILSGGFIL